MATNLWVTRLGGAGALHTLKRARSWSLDIFERGRPSPTGDTHCADTANRRLESASHIPLFSSPGSSSSKLTFRAVTELKKKNLTKRIRSINFELDIKIYRAIAIWKGFHSEYYLGHARLFFLAVDCLARVLVTGENCPLAAATESMA
jgi:hypothetical protein